MVRRTRVMEAVLAGAMLTLSGGPPPAEEADRRVALKSAMMLTATTHTRVKEASLAERG